MNKSFNTHPDRRLSPAWVVAVTIVLATAGGFGAAWSNVQNLIKQKTAQAADLEKENKALAADTFLLGREHESLLLQASLTLEVRRRDIPLVETMPEKITPAPEAPTLEGLTAAASTTSPAAAH